MFNKNAKQIEELQIDTVITDQKLDAILEYLGAKFVYSYCPECGSPMVTVEEDYEDCCDCSPREVCECPCHDDEWEDVDGKCN